MGIAIPRDAIRAAIVGGAAGDVLGGIVERGARTLSDDTQLTLATCEAILEAGNADPASIARRMCAWFSEGRVTGLGSRTLKALRDLQSGAHWALAGARGERAAGNGAAMRIAPVAFVLDPAAAEDRVRIADITRITHHHDEAYIGALAVVVALRRAATSQDWSNGAIVAELHDSRVRDNLTRAERLEGRGLAAVLAEIGASGFVAETVPAALCLARMMCARGVEPAMIELNRLGGDTDTIGSIAAQIWGAATREDAGHLLEDVPGGGEAVEIAERFASFVGVPGDAAAE